MLKKLFASKRPAPPSLEPTPSVARAPAGEVIWAVGDIHGRLDLLEPLLAYMSEDARADGRRTSVVFLGDYIDRGPDSRGVIEALQAFSPPWIAAVHFLRGNHEEKMETFLSDPSIGPTWCEYGGREALRDFGVRVPALAHKSDGWLAASRDLDHALTPLHRAFFARLEDQVSIGDYFFAHAGARPGLALEEQEARDLRWIRSSFLHSDHRFDKVVVHGHTPGRLPHSDARRIGVDTHAYQSGVLTAVRLEGEDRRFFQAVEGAAGVIEAAVDAIEVDAPPRRVRARAAV